MRRATVALSLLASALGAGAAAAPDRNAAIAACQLYARLKTAPEVSASPRTGDLPGTRAARPAPPAGGGIPAPGAGAGAGPGSAGTAPDDAQFQQVFQDCVEKLQR